MGKCIEGNVVMEMLIGKTRVKICDDCCVNKTSKDVDIILNDIANIVVGNLSYIGERGRTFEHSEV